METENFIQYMRIHRHPEKIPDMERYMRNKFKFLGLQAAERRKLARPFMNEWRKKTKEKAAVDWETLRLFWELPEREFQLIGIDYLKDAENYLVYEDLNRLRQLIGHKSWWDTVDFLAKNVGYLAQKEPEIKEVLLAWSKDENIWIRRTAILHQLKYKKQTDRPLLRQILVNNLNASDFFINKAMGWALREYAKTDKNWVRDFIAAFEIDLDPLTIREATKNMT
jgi:3-methyladenine DNA glycosylase AlkD